MTIFIGISITHFFLLCILGSILGNKHAKSPLIPRMTFMAILGEGESGGVRGDSWSKLYSIYEKTDTR